MKAPLAAILALFLGGQCLAELIEIGTRKQLFFDDHLIESRTGARQVLNPGVKAAGNPVVRQDRPWEGNDIKPKGVPKRHPEGEPWARRRGYQGYLWGPTSMMGWDPIRQADVAYMDTASTSGAPSGSG